MSVRAAASQSGPIATAYSLVAAVVIGCSMLAAPRSAQAQSDPEIRREIQERVATLRAIGRLDVDGERIRYSALLAQLYERRGFGQVWTEPNDVHALVSLIGNAATDGLIPDHYGFAALTRSDSVSGDAARIADLDLLRTDAALRVAYHLRFGRVDAAHNAPNRSLDRPLWGTDAAAAADSLLHTGSLSQRARSLRPVNFAYTGMVAALARLRAIDHQGGWPTVPPGTRLEPGIRDPRVLALRRRLALDGDLAADDRSALFDAALDSAVRSFQHRHGLNVDGVVGPTTLAALNVPVARRIDQVRVNLERARWLGNDVPERAVVVNVAGALVYFVRAGVVQLETRVVVGRPHTRTPTFSAPLRYIELNPTWTVPPGIVHEILAQIRHDPGYLRQQKIHVFTRSGRALNARGIDFRQYTGATFPYVFRQDPGPLNPLGRIKFVFPNRYNVFLHDTPSPQLFEREQRTFSHGCVRVESPLRLAEALLDNPERWNVAALQREIDRGITQTIPLREPVPVLMLYWTAAADATGVLHFFADVYGRDAGVLRALNTS